MIITENRLLLVGCGIVELPTKWMNVSLDDLESVMQAAINRKARLHS